MVLIISVLIGITLDLTSAKPAVKYYASKYDHIDVEAILNNRRMVNYYSACLLSQGPCPPEGVEFKRILPESLQTNCGRCTEKQATIALRAIKRLKKEYPKIWSQLAEKWDPDDIYVQKFESTHRNKGGLIKPSASQEPNFISNRFDDSHTSDNTIDGHLSPTSTASQLNSSTQNRPDSTTHKVITSTNSIPSFIISTSTKSGSSKKPTLLTSTPSTTITTSKATSRVSFIASTSTRSPSSVSPPISSTTTTRLPPIPGFLPLNTFFTNPPIRPIVNLNIGANIGATVSGFVRGLGAIGSRVMETGAEIAEVVVKNLAKPLPL